MNFQKRTRRLTAITTAAAMVISNLPTSIVQAEVNQWTTNGDGSYS